jgi:hypothetical protein
MALRTDQCCSSVARTHTKEAYSDDSAHAEWSKTTDDIQATPASQKYLKAHADSRAETGEVHQMRGDHAMRL